MSDAPPRLRSGELLARESCALLVIDVQERLVPAILNHRRLVWNVRRLIDGAKLMQVPILATEQYPRGLGATVPELAARLGERLAKTAFSCGGCAAATAALQGLGVRQVLLCGMETHVCVLQTALDLLSAGYRLFLAVDAIGSRGELDAQVALRRLEAAGATLLTVESALFEWCVDSAAPEFKQVSALVRETPPAA